MTTEFSFSDDDLTMPVEEEFEEENLSDVRSTIAADVHMKGELHLRNGVEINGSFKGTLKSNSKVRVLDKGNLEGKVEAFHVILEGTSKSKMTARKRFEILKGGKFFGTLETQPELIILSEFATFGQDERIAKEFAREFVRDRSTQNLAEAKSASTPAEAVSKSKESTKASKSTAPKEPDPIDTDTSDEEPESA